MFINNSFRATNCTPPGGTTHFVTCLKGTCLEYNHNVRSIYFATVLPLLYNWFILSSCHCKPSHWSPCYQPTLSAVTILMKIWSGVALLVVKGHIPLKPFQAWTKPFPILFLLPDHTLLSTTDISLYQPCSEWDAPICQGQTGS